MAMPKKQIDFNATYNSKMCGTFKIIKELDTIRDHGVLKRMVLIKFITTGTEQIVSLSQASSGSVKDPFYPTVYGIGYLGDLDGAVYTKKEYDMWFSMLKRCYNTSYDSYKSYGAIGVTVDPRWFCFANFLLDLPLLPGYYEYSNAEDKENFALDKDAKQRDVNSCNKVYSKDTCTIIRKNDNSMLTSITRKSVGTSSGYYGVYRLSDSRFQSSINVDGIKYFLGTYSNEIAAASVYNFVAAKCYKEPVLNNPNEMMHINTALKYRTSRTPLKLPPNIDISMLKVPQNTSSPYSGVEKRGDMYVASYFKDGRKICIGTFTDEIAAANAANFGNMFYGGGNSHMNNVPYMQAYEWLQYRTYARGYIAKGEICRIVNK